QVSPLVNLCPPAGLDDRRGIKLKYKCRSVDHVPGLEPAALVVRDALRALGREPGQALAGKCDDRVLAACTQTLDGGRRAATTGPQPGIHHHDRLGGVAVPVAALVRRVEGRAPVAAGWLRHGDLV